MLELLYRKFTKTQRPDAIVLYDQRRRGPVKVSFITSKRCMRNYATLGLTHYVTSCATMGV